MILWQMLHLLLRPCNDFQAKNKSHFFLFQCTTYDLLEKGMEVHIVADAVSSRRCLNFPVAYFYDCESSLHASNKYLKIEKTLLHRLQMQIAFMIPLDDPFWFSFIRFIWKRNPRLRCTADSFCTSWTATCVFFSRSQTDRLFALSRLKQSGAYLTTTEAVLLQLVRDAKHPNFKEVLCRHRQPLFIRRLSLSVYPVTNLAVHPQVLSKVEEENNLTWYGDPVPNMVDAVDRSNTSTLLSFRWSQ